MGIVLFEPYEQCVMCVFEIVKVEIDATKY